MKVLPLLFALAALGMSHQNLVPTEPPLHEGDSIGLCGPIEAPMTKIWKAFCAEFPSAIEKESHRHSAKPRLFVAYPPESGDVWTIKWKMTESDTWNKAPYSFTEPNFSPRLVRYAARQTAKDLFKVAKIDKHIQSLLSHYNTSH